MDFKHRLQRIIFGYSTPAGKLFDVVLIIAIIGSVFVVMVDSVPSIHDKYGVGLNYFEWFFTILFTIEYIIRVYVAKNPWSYIFSFYGMVDLLSTIPTYIAIFVPGGETLLMLRTLRLMRIFRIFKLGHYVRGSHYLWTSVLENRGKIVAFLTAVLSVVMILGSLMYIVEGSKNGFTSIPRSIYWAIVTVTTVGFGDISPQTSLGQLIASLLMLIGYSIIAVPTGIIGTGVGQAEKREEEGNRECSRCASKLHSDEDLYCWKCGEKQ